MAKCVPPSTVRWLIGSVAVTAFEAGRGRPGMPGDDAIEDLTRAIREMTQADRRPASAAAPSDPRGEPAEGFGRQRTLGPEESRQLGEMSGRSDVAPQILAKLFELSSARPPGLRQFLLPESPWYSEARLDACVVTIMANQLVTIVGGRSTSVPVRQLRDELTRLGDRGSKKNLLRDLRRMPGLVVTTGGSPTVCLATDSSGNLTQLSKVCCSDAASRVFNLSRLRRYRLANA